MDGKRVRERESTKPADLGSKRSAAEGTEGLVVHKKDSGADFPDAEEEALVFEDPYGDHFDENEEDSSYNEDESDGEGEGDEGRARGGKKGKAAKSSAAAAAGAGMEEDDDHGDGEDEEDYDEDSASRRHAQLDREVFRPGIDTLAEGETLEVDMSAYVMLHRMAVDWPCLSFDVVPDKLGAGRKKFPLSCTVVAGTQADKPGSNKLMVMRFSSLHRTQKDDRDSDDDDDDDDEDDDDLDDDAELHVERIAHQGAVNRVRVMPQEPHVVASWSETGKVHLWDIRPHLKLLDAHEGVKGATAAPIPRGYGPIKTFDGHKEEGFAVAWSHASPGRLATGDCGGSILVWDVDSRAAASALSSSSSSAAELGAIWSVNTESPFVSGSKKSPCSVEDIQWSPNESTVFASCGTDGCVRIWDTRAKSGQCMLHCIAHQGTDVNVISWSPLVSFLMLSGADDGAFKVWDLRRMAPGGGSALAGAAEGGPLPLAHFRWHRKPVTSLEWAFDDENTFCVSSEDGTVTVWDMSLEADEEAEMKMGASAGSSSAPSKAPSTKDPRLADIPPQLLFVHGGQEDVKEAHFHRQIPGLVISTAADGFNVFKPDVVVTT